MPNGLLSGLLGTVDSYVTPAKRRLADLLINPLAYTQQAFGQVGQNIANFSQNALLADDGLELKRMNSVMGDLPMYKNALSAVTQGLMGVAPVGATVYHSSPYKFDKFDSSKIGAGEGAQAYGIGAYLADSPAVSGEGGVYFNQFKTHPAVKETGGPFAYKVDLPDDAIAKMLDWDKPLSQQSPEVKRALQKRGFDVSGKDYGDTTLYDKFGVWEPKDLTGGVAVEKLHQQLGRKKLAEELKSQGIPGIRYLDDGSRNAGGGTSNYVVFPGNENLLQILERNGKPLK